jgi:alanine racemase
MTHTRPTWAEISRGRLCDNYRLLRSRASADAELLAVVKADAYGHGLLTCAPVLAGAGARWLGVTSVEEGVALRAVCPDVRILIMSGLWAGEAETALEQTLTPVVWEPAHVQWLELAARKRSLPAGSVPVHLEVDTGMSRQGIAPGRLNSVLEWLGPASALSLEVVMTHFHSPEDLEATRAQERVFAEAIDWIAARGLRPKFLSAGSSATLLRRDLEPLRQMATRIGARPMLRPGIALYGYAPCPGTETGLRPVLTWKTRVTGLREIETGETAGYDATFRATRRTRLALLPVGYADGFNRLLSNRGAVVIRGQRAPLAGRISMDQTMVDVTGIPDVAGGDEVVLMGEQGEAKITAHDVAAMTGSICWEVLCAISARVPRVMVD